MIYHNKCWGYLFDFRAGQQHDISVTIYLLTGKESYGPYELVYTKTFYLLDFQNYTYFEATVDYAGNWTWWHWDTGWLGD